jgi:hypothetical protein
LTGLERQPGVCDLAVAVSERDVMHLPFRRDRHLTETLPPLHDDHVISSAFSTEICRFVLDCSCGDHFDTRYIDEALEYREMHERLAPLTDQMRP